MHWFAGRSWTADLGRRQSLSQLAHHSYARAPEISEVCETLRGRMMPARGPFSDLTAKRFTGQYHEAAPGLYFYNARWYDPLLGRARPRITCVSASASGHRARFGGGRGG